MTRFYVYELIDPRTDKVFYVGKGQNDRVDQHEIEAARGGQSHKCNLIRKIKASGNKVKKNIVQRFSDENEAYSFETKRISEIGLENLTNVMPGGPWSNALKVARNPNSLKTTEAQDARIAKGCALASYYSGGFKYGRAACWVFGKEFVLPDFLIDSAKEMLVDIYKRRGAEWLKLKAKIEFVEV